MSLSPRTHRSPAVAIRRAEVLRRRAAGHSYADIADALDIPITTARKDLQRAMRQVIQEAGAELVALETARTERILAEAFAIVDTPDTTPRDRAIALREATRVLERRARLLGLDADSKAGQRREEDADIADARSLLGQLFGSLETAAG